MILDDEIPKGTERDNRLLKKQQKSINDAQKAIAAACAASVVLPEGKVPGIPSGTTLSDALNLITNNHVRTVNFFRAVAIKNESSGDFEKSFILTGDDTAFRAAVRANYAQKAANDCRVSGDFFKNISAAMDRIGSLGGKIGEAIADWEEAWDMLNNASAPKGSNALKLSFGMGGEGDTGFSMGADLAAEQSAKYDNPPEALGVGAQLRSIGQKIVSTMESIAPQYLPVEQAIKNAEHTEEVPPLVRKITEARAFDTDVATQYKTLEALIGEAKETTQTNVTELVKMHATLVNLANAIGKAVPVSEKACDDQSTGKGTCEYRK
ncbi:MAG TPA: hypothetical protein PK765_04910 [bacterium]|nr:hypothetical protein [bacterium]